MNKLRALLTMLNLHIAVVALLLIFDIALGAKVMLAMHAINADQSPSFTAEEIHYGKLQTRMNQIHDLPAKVTQARAQAAQFIQKRFAPNYSTIAAELGNLASKNHVRLANAQLTQKSEINGILRVRIDASLSGQYAPLMHFINDLERAKDHVFFIITGLAFNGEQHGNVSLRIRMDTYLRPGANVPAIASKPSSKSGQNNPGASDNTARIQNPRPPASSREVR